MPAKFFPDFTSLFLSAGAAGFAVDFHCEILNGIRVQSWKNTIQYLVYKLIADFYIEFHRTILAAFLVLHRTIVA
ncbi:hypothetical protein [Undibacterium curvum]|uniref:Uncharacterized protein n=1 Tax=Undibacterium curvum TaxID=2762294 RepID=A0ABR7A7Q7_9BURK|nr:hypothetical protein [Undibacterium curvum]MBC3932886.1 hypothetical protein [Undibacterium curvum]